MIVVDASVALKWVVPEIDSAKARALHAQALAAPAIWIVEASNALWRRVRVGEMTELEAMNRLSVLRTASLDARPVEPDIPRALTLAIEIAHPIYDCLYLALAIREGTHVVTADNGFALAVRNQARWTAHLKLLSET